MKSILLLINFLLFCILLSCNQQNNKPLTEEEIQSIVETSIEKSFSKIPKESDESIDISAIKNIIKDSINEEFSRFTETMQDKKLKENIITAVEKALKKYVEKAVKETLDKHIENAVDKSIKETLEEEVEKAVKKSLDDKLEKALDEAVKKILKKMQLEPKLKPTEKPAVESKTLKINVANDDWGGSRPADIQKVVYSAASELWKYFPSRKLKPIIVVRSKTVPRVLYRHSQKGEIVVQISSGYNRWSQFAYQFAHEFCHILCNYADDKKQQNKWFEESVCETASIFAINRMAQTWKTKPPYSNWKTYSASLKSYFDNCMKDKERYLPKNTTLKKWYKDNRKKLAGDPYQRNMNKKVATFLYKILDKKPESWEAVQYLNQGKPDKTNSFKNYLSRWLQYAPSKHKKFVKSIGKLFSIEIK